MTWGRGAGKGVKWRKVNTVSAGVVAWDRECGCPFPTGNCQHCGWHWEPPEGGTNSMYFFLPLLPHLHVLSSSWCLSTWLPAGWFMQDKPGSRASPGEQPGQRR